VTDSSASRPFRFRFAVALLPLVVAGVACKSGGIPEGGGDGETAGRGGSEAGQGGSGTPAGGSGSGGSAAGSAGSGIAINCGHDDCDGDGFLEPLDCDDTDATINPAAFDFVGDKIDNDCSGQADDPVETCEPSPAFVPGTPQDFARAMDICPQRTVGKDGKVFDPLLQYAWGKVSGPGLSQQNWTSETKPAIQTNIVSSFGQNTARLGGSMIGLSTGPWATKTPHDSDPLDPASFSLLDACASIPLGADDCKILSNGAPKGGLSVQDFAELDVWLQVPTNAKGVSFDFSFFTAEFTQYWNTATNDAFFVLASNAQFTGLNVAKQANGTGISVNSGFFQLCPKAPPAGLTADKLPALQNCVGNDGDAASQVFGSLTGTYYDGAASAAADGTVTSIDGTKKYLYGGGTGWLTSTFPVTPGESIMLRFMIMDTFDGLKDSTVLIDRFTWIQVPTEAGVIRPPK
jgi:hypothetical protein